MTFGRLRFNLKRRFPSIDLDSIEDTIMYRYQAILDHLRWVHQERPAGFNTALEMNAGTLAVVNGSPVVTITGAVFTPQVNGWLMRINASGEFYEFTPDPLDLTGATGLLDRGYVGSTAAAVPYRLNQASITWPQIPVVSNVLSVRPLDNSEPLGFLSREDAAAMYPNRNSYGRPLYWSKRFIDGATVPGMAIDLYPTPTEMRSYVAELQFDQDSQTAPPSADLPDSVFLPWVRPACLEHGCAADLERRMKDRNAAIDEEALYEKHLYAMVELDCRRRGPQTMRMDRGYVTPYTGEERDPRFFRR